MFILFLQSTKTTITTDFYPENMQTVALMLYTIHMYQNIAKLLIVVVFTLMSVSPAVASGKLTTTDTNSGVVIREENDVRYLTTTVHAQEATLSATATPSATASPGSDPQQEYFQIPEGFFTEVDETINRLIRIVFAVSALLTFAYLIWGAFQWITSGGDKSKTDKARSAIIAAVVGLIIVASSYAILVVALNFLGYEDLNDVLDDVDQNTEIELIS